MYLIFFLINIFINIFLNNIIDLLFFGINKIIPSLQLIENYLMSQKTNTESLEFSNVIANTEELSLIFNLYASILNKYEFNQLVNNSNDLTRASTIVEYFNICCNFVEEVIILNQKLYYEHISNLFNSIHLYKNLKILLNKNLINNNNLNELMYNITFDLILDNVSLNYKGNSIFYFGKDEICISENYFRGVERNKQLGLNYCQGFKKTPIDVSLKLFKITQENSRLISILNYGLDYDVSILKNKNYFLSENQSLKSKNIDTNNFLINDVNLFQKNYYKGYEVTKYNDQEEELLKLNFLETNFKYNEVLIIRYENSGNLFKYKSNLFLNKDKKVNNFLSFNKRQLFGSYSYGGYGHKDMTYTKRYKIKSKNIVGKELEFIGNRAKGQLDNFDIRKYYIDLQNPLKKIKVPRKIYKSYIGLYSVYSGRLSQFLDDHGIKLNIDIFVKKKYLKYLLHGVKGFELEKKFFKSFLKSDDVGLVLDYGFANSTDKFLIYYNTLYQDYIMSDKKYSKAFGVNERIEFLNFRVNRPKIKNKKSLKPYSIAFLHTYLDSPNMKNGFKNYKELYIKFLKQICIYMEYSNYMSFKSNSATKNFLQKLYVVNLGVRKDYLKFTNIINKNNITGNEFYSNIEDVAQEYNLNYIQKEFYGRHYTNNLEKFLLKKSKLMSETELPKNLNVLIKKTYIENLIDAYKVEEEPMKNYIYYKLRKEFFIDDLKIYGNIIYNILYNIIGVHGEGLKMMNEYIILKVTKIMELKELRHFKTFFNMLKANYEYIGILIIGCTYSLICSLLIVLIKSILPKNLVYGIKKSEKLNFLEKLVSQLGELDDKPYFNFEYKYIYKGNTKNEKRGEKKKMILNRYKAKVNENIVENYGIFYKKFLFETNLSKGENNTKVRFNYKIGLKNKGLYIGAFFKVFQVFFRDRKYNHNRKIIGKDPNLDSHSKVKYYHEIPRYFANIGFIFHFVISVFQIGEYRYFVMKGTQLVKYGITSGLNYKTLEKELEQDLSLEGYKDNLDFGVGLLYTNFLEIKNKLNKINKEHYIKKKETDRIIKENQNTSDMEELLKDIITLSIEARKLKKITKFQAKLKELKNERFDKMHFELKFENIKEKLKAEIPVISEKEKIKQTLMHKYRYLVQQQKLTMLEEELKVIKQSYTRRIAHSHEDKKNRLTVLEPEYIEKLRDLKTNKVGLIKYERISREKNYENEIIDKVLDKKELTMFESIKEYNEDLSEAVASLDRKERMLLQEKSNYEQTSKALYNNLEQSYISYRFYTTMGARFYYILSMLYSLFTIGNEHITKVRRNDYSFLSLILIIKIDLLKYIYKIYGEYILVGKKYETFKKLGNQFKVIFKFSLLILTPITIIAFFLYLSLGLYYILTKKLKFNLTNKIKKIKNIIFLKRIGNKLIRFKDHITILKILFINIETGENLGSFLYKKFYNICGFIQRTLYYIKGAFILGYKTGGLFCGIKNILKGISLKYKAYLEKKYILKKNKKKKNGKNGTNFIIEKKKNITLKVHMILILGDIERSLINIYGKLIKLTYRYVVYPLFKIDYLTYYKSFNQSLRGGKKTNINLYNKFILLKVLINKLTIVEFLKLLINFIGELIILPIKFVNNYYKSVVLATYKKGVIINFGNIFKFIKIKNNNEVKKSLKISLHDILLTKKISIYLKNKKILESSTLEIYLIFKYKERRLDKHKDHYLFGKEIYGTFKEIKIEFFDIIINFVDVIEETYASFEVSFETKNGSYYQRIKYGYFANKLKNQLENKKFKNNEKKFSRNFFFMKKSKEREKLIRKYFVKGVLNGISYITTGKVIFKKIKELKKQKIKIKNLNYKYINYNLNNLSEKYHIGKYLDDVPPQLGALVIIYEIYYKNFFRYIFGHGDDEVPKPGTTDLKNSRDRKGRMSSPINRKRIPYRNTAYITVDVTHHDLNELYVNLKKKPYDPIIRGIYFIIENNLMSEVLAKKGNEVGGDISLTHLLTYNNKLDSYKYEIREFFRILEGNSFLRRAENQLAIDKKKDYDGKHIVLGENIHNQNKNIVAEILEERRNHAVKLLYKSLLYYKEIDGTDQDLITDDEKSQDIFYAMKVRVFEEHDIAEFLEGKSTFESKLPELKYFNRQDLDYLKSGQRSEYAKLNIEGIPIELDVLANHIVLLSFDQTGEDIRSFLKIDILKKIENKNNIINYPNLNIINPSIIKNIYGDSYIEIEPRREYGKHFYGTTKVKDSEDELFSYIKLDFDIMKGKRLKYDVFYGFQQNHIINRYYESGKVYIYNEKDKYDTSIITLDIEESFHGNYLFSEWVSKILKRRLNLKNIKRSSGKIKKIKEDNNDNDAGVIAYVNNIRGTGEQGLGYGNIEQEEDLLKKNLLILYDRCNIGVLKRAPIRLKLPVKLALSKQDIKNFLKAYKKERGYLETNYFLLANSVSGMLKSSLEFSVGRRQIELKYNKNIGDIIFGIITEYDDKEVKKLTKEHEYILENFIQNFVIFNKLFYVGLPAYTGDLIRYHDLFCDLDEFEYYGYLELKQKEYLMHDVALRKYAHKLINLAITKYNPGIYVFMYNEKKVKYFYGIFNISAKISLLIFLDVLFYHPGQYIANIHILFCPFMFYIIFLYLKRYMKKIREIKEGRDLNLYRYQDYEDASYIDKILLKEEKMSKTINKYNFFRNTELTQVDFSRKFKDKRPEGEQLESITREKRNLREKNNFYYNFSALEKLSKLGYILVMCTLTEMWGTQKFRFRNNKYFGDFYLPEEQELYSYMPEFEFIERSYTTRTGEYDCYGRFDGGGNVYSRGYENKYREFHDKELLELDPGYYASQIVKNQDLYMGYNDYTVVHMKAGLVDAHGNHFARRACKDIPEFLDISKYDYMLLDTEEALARRTKRRSNLPTKFELKEFAFQPERIDFYANIFEIFGVTIRNSIMDILRYLILGPDLGKLYNPIVQGLEFKKNMLDEYGYDIKKNVITVMFEAKAATKTLIVNDINRYFEGKLNTLIAEHNRKQRLIYLQNNSFEKELPLDLKVLYLMPENEKHLNLLYSNFLKYKLKRLDYYINSVNLKKKDLKNITTHKLEVELYYNKQEKYLTSIFRKISYEDRVEYKANLGINFFKEEKGTGSYLRDFIYNYPLSNSTSIGGSISEYSDILLKIISNL